MVALACAKSLDALYHTLALILASSRSAPAGIIPSRALLIGLETNSRSMIVSQIERPAGSSFCPASAYGKADRRKRHRDQVGQDDSEQARAVDSRDRGRLNTCRQPRHVKESHNKAQSLNTWAIVAAVAEAST